MLEFLKLGLFVTTLKEILFRPVSFFRKYHELVTTRSGHFWNLNQEKDTDPFMNPVAFAALSVVISNLLYPVILYLGVQVGAVSPETLAFSNWAESKGYLKPPSFTGVLFLDDLVRKGIVLVMMYGLGWLISLYSGKAVHARFAAGYFFYWNAWSVLSSLVTTAMIVLGLVVPIYSTGLPQLLNTLLSLASLLMFVGFPILYWPRWVNASRKKVTLALLGGLLTWIVILAIIAPMIVTMPNMEQSPQFGPRYNALW
ncbi:MAG: hypothetical protein EP343_31875 [Deltaproteobacteria bacterium]|nr:MAG: hypothetical protein EP343_31875 [Deltaproteobacteria bacterium]